MEIVEGLLLYDPKTGSYSDEQVSCNLNWDEIHLHVRRTPTAAITPALRQLWEKTITKPQKRGVLERALMEATIFMPPLYVGKANNLQRRYWQHVNGTATDANSFHKRFSEFVVGHDIMLAVSDLLFVCIGTTFDEDSRLERLGINELVEQLLMRLCRPPFSIR